MSTAMIGYGIPYIPMVTLDFHTPDALYSANGSMQPTDDLRSVSTIKHLADPAGTWQASFVYRRGSDGKTWFDRINPMDVCVIKMGKKSYPTVTEGVGLDTVMVGLVDEVHVSRQMGADGSPQRVVNIIGRDFGKMLVQAQLHFYPSLQDQSGSTNILTQDGWVAMTAFFMGNQIENGSPAQMIHAVMSKLLPKLMTFTVPFWDAQKGKMSIKSTNILRWRLGKSNFLQPFMMTLQNYEGTLWNLIQQVSESPFNEVFVDTMPMKNYNGMLLNSAIEEDSTNAGYSPVWGTDGAKVVLTLRPTPFDAANWSNLPITQIGDHEIESLDFAKSDSEAYNLFFAGESLSIPTTTDLKAVAPPVYDEAKAMKYGIQPLEVTIQGISTYGGQDQQAIAASKVLSKQLHDWYDDNDVYRSGTFVVKGRGDMRIGTRVLYEPDDTRDESLEAYIEGVEQSYVYFSEADSGEFNTTITFTRGQAPTAAKYVAPVVSDKTTTTAPKAQVAPPAPTKSYTVKVGDTLSSIAAKEYGNPGDWKIIWGANKTMLIARDARNNSQPGHWIYPGQVLKIPPK